MNNELSFEDHTILIQNIFRSGDKYTASLKPRFSEMFPHCDTALFVLNPKKVNWGKLSILQQFGFFHNLQFTEFVVHCNRAITYALL